MASIFTRIINRDIPAQIVAEDDNYLAFLDINPLAKGHTLAIPKKEVDYIFDLDDETLTGLHLFAKKVAKRHRKGDIMSTNWHDGHWNRSSTRPYSLNPYQTLWMT